MIVIIILIIIIIIIVIIIISNIFIQGESFRYIVFFNGSHYIYADSHKYKSYIKATIPW